MNNLAGIKEYSLSIDDFNEPKVYEGAESIMLLLTRLILLEPGTFQSHPDMGVGLISQYRFRTNDGSLESDLQGRIKTQIDSYLPLLTGVDVRVKVQNKTYYVSMVINGIIYGILYDTNSNMIHTEYKSISDL